MQASPAIRGSYAPSEGGNIALAGRARAEKDSQPISRAAPFAKKAVALGVASTRLKVWSIVLKVGKHSRFYFQPFPFPKSRRNIGRTRKHSTRKVCRARKAGRLLTRAGITSVYFV